MGGGGSSRTQSASDAKYPEEFKPLASSAVKQIQNMQNALPLQYFAGANPAGVADVSPYQQAAMNMLPNTLAPTWGLSQMQQMNPAFNSVMANATQAGNNPNAIYSGALQALTSGGFGQGQQSFPGMPTQFMNMGRPQVQAPQAQQTVMGPGTANLIPQLQARLNAPIQPGVGIKASPVTGPAANQWNNIRG